MNTLTRTKKRMKAVQNSGHTRRKLIHYAFKRFALLIFSHSEHSSRKLMKKEIRCTDSFWVLETPSFKATSRFFSPTLLIREANRRHVRTREDGISRNVANLANKKETKFNRSTMCIRYSFHPFSTARNLKNGKVKEFDHVPVPFL